MTTDPETLESLASDMDAAATGSGKYFVDPAKAKQIADALRNYAKTLPDPGQSTLRQIIEVAIRLRSGRRKADPPAFAQPYRILTDRPPDWALKPIAGGDDPT